MCLNIASGPPDPPSNCSVVNQTTDSLEVWCRPGFDGGLRQSFVMVVTDLSSGEELANATEEDAPEFRVTGLNSGRGMRMRIYSVNQDGASNATVLEGNTLKVAELQIGEEGEGGRGK